MVKVVPVTTACSVFHVHKKLLAFRSTYFQDLFERQSQPETYALETCSLICRWFLEWVYSDSIPKVEDTDFTALFDFFLLAQRVCKHARLEDLIMNRIRQHCRQGVREYLLREVIDDCYEKLKAKSPLRRWIVKYVAWNLVTKKHEATEYQSLIEEGGPFAMDLVLTLLSVASGPFPNPLEEPDCKYHKHAEDVECDARSFPEKDCSVERE